MKHLNLNIINFIKILSIVIIGSTNATTFALLFYKVWGNNAFAIASIAVFAVATVTGIMIFLKIAKRYKQRNLDTQ